MKPSAAQKAAEEAAAAQKAAEETAVLSTTPRYNRLCVYEKPKACKEWYDFWDNRSHIGIPSSACRLYEKQKGAH